MTNSSKELEGREGIEICILVSCRDIALSKKLTPLANYSCVMELADWIFVGIVTHLL